MAKLTLQKTFVRTMDAGEIRFGITLSTLETWGKQSHALIQFPNYYSASLGQNITCQLERPDKTLEVLFCQMAWDWSLEIWASKTHPMKKGEAFALIISGVTMNNPPSAQVFQIGFAPDHDLSRIEEFGLLADSLQAKGWTTEKPVKVLSISTSINDIRSKTDLVITFEIPETTDKILDGGDFVSVSLPFQWRNVLRAGFSGTVDISAVNSAGLKTSIGKKLLSWSAAGLVAQIDVAGEKFREKSRYILTIKDLPTPEQGRKVDTTINSLVLSVGGVVSSAKNSPKGSAGWSSTAFWTFNQPIFDVKKGLTVLEYDVDFLQIKRGTYSGAFCISPKGNNNFGTNIDFTTSGYFKIYPAILHADAGSAKICGLLGVNSTT